MECAEATRRVLSPHTVGGAYAHEAAEAEATIFLDLRTHIATSDGRGFWRERRDLNPRPPA